MKKIIISILAVIILGLASYWAIQQDAQKSTLSKNDTDFNLKDTAQVVRIFIAKKDGESFHFVKQENGEWLVNNEWNSDAYMAKLILGTINEMTIKSPVPKEARNFVVTELAAKGIKVELYNKQGLIKTFYVGESTNDVKGTYMIMHGSENPYILHIPRFDGYLTTRFDVRKEFWIDKSIFKSIPKNIKSVSVNYPSSPENNFTINQNNGFLNIDGIKQLDTLKVREYLAQFAKVYGEKHVTVNDKKVLDDSLAAVMPMAIVELEDANPTLSGKITLYNINDIDRMLGYIHHKDQYVTTQFITFNPIMVKKIHFSKASN